MDAKTISLVKESFAKVETIKEKASEMFYGRLFEIRPDIKPLFKTDLMFQGQRLMGESFTDELKQAWGDVYTLLSGAMKDAAATANS